MLIDLSIEAVKAIIVVVMVLNLAGILLWVERKGSALIQDRIGANRASITGLGKRMGLPNFGLVNTLLADPLKLFTEYLTAQKLADQARFDAIHAEVKTEVDKAVQFALAASYPSVDKVDQDVYA